MAMRPVFVVCSLIFLLLLSAGSVRADQCSVNETFLSCGGTPDACSSYVASGTCSAAGCNWGSTTVNTTVWSEGFASYTDWATFSADGAGISQEASSSNCINDANDQCIRIDDDNSPTNPYYLTKQSSVNLASCNPGTAKFNIGKVAEASGNNLESTDCVYAWFSANNGSTWSNRTLIFCNDDPASTFSTTLNNGLLTSGFRVRIEKQNFTNDGTEEAFLDNFNVTCATAGPSTCTGSPAACSTYGGDSTCDAAGCTSTCSDNPQIANSCGVDIALIIDSSGSISTSELNLTKTAFKGFVDAFLPNTASQIAVVDFDDTAALEQDYTSNVTAIKNAIDGTSSGGATNWEDALEEAHAQFDNRASKPDIFIFASDGNPNRYGDGPTTTTEATAVAQAVLDAQAIKADGIRIITLGIGNELDANNLIAISSADAYYESDFATLATDLAQLADDLCGGTVTVRKYVDGTPAQNWTFSANATNGVLTPSSTSTDSDGFATFNIENISGPTATVNLAEILKGGYEFKNATCTVGNQTRGSAVGTGVNGVSVAANEAVFCVFNNHVVTFCGDSIVQNPNDNGTQESCDVGAGNGITCTPGYGTSCTYCNSQCGNTTLNGPYCGDGLVNGNETCDGINGTPEHYACTQSCQLEYVPYCGDEIVNQGNETCDAGAGNGVACTPSYGSSCGYCSGICANTTLNGPFCGDQIVNGNESCEIGDNVTDPEHYTCNAQTCELDYNPYCGDGIQNQQSEQCDDGNQNDTDACRNSCNVPVCGNSEVEFGETCDDGNLENGDGCNAICTSEYCGDGVDNNGDNEQCDDGNTNNSDSCTNVCAFAACGDTFIQDGEYCDDGNTANGDGCTSTCGVEFCGDYSINNNGTETCDNGAVNGIACVPEYGNSCTYCGSICQPINVTGPFCGDDVVNGNESCEVGDLSADPEHYTCNAQTCELDYNPYCGDGQVNQISEVCDDGNQNDTDACSNSCAAASCGDSVLQSVNGESCDDGNTANNDGCNAICQNEFCGDDVVNGNESCEIGDNVTDPEHYTCNAQTCELDYNPYCGDGAQDDGEFCDDGNNQSGDGCTSTCGVEFCGDYSINNNGTETCDNGAVNGIACTPEYGSTCGYCDSQCQPANVTGPYCGDQIVNGQEACDGDAPENYVCTDSCELVYIPFCGDGNIDDGETCDGTNGTPEHYTCTDSCALEYVPFCGDQTVNQESEQCDGNAPENYICTQNCTLQYVPYCGDGNVDDSEECDGSAPEGSLCSNSCELIACDATGILAEGETVTETLYGIDYNVSLVLVSDANEGDNNATFGLNSELTGALSEDETFDSNVTPGLSLTAGDIYVGGRESNAKYCLNVPAPTCGDQVVNQESEQCDGSAPEHYTCDEQCQLHYAPFCGDQQVNQETEQCDGSAPEGYTCTQECELEQTFFCGDGVVNQESEQCDIQDGVPEGYTCFQDCSLHLTCEEAIAQGLLYGEIVNGTAIVQNDAEDDFLVSLASYEMYAPLIEDQVLYSSDTQLVEGGSSAEFGVAVPACSYQIDLVCGEPLPSNPDYSEEEKLDFDFSTGLEFCVPDQDEEISVTVVEGFPQCGNYVFQCDVEGFEPTAYYWYFGDGQIQPNSTNDNVYHTYEENGAYTVTCTATDGENYASGSVEIDAVTCPTCEEAIAQGLLYGEIVNGTAIVYNDANTGYDVSLASYEMYALLIEDQVLYDSNSAFVESESSAELAVDVPACTYQIDLVCGDALPFAPLYGDRVIDFDFANQEGEFCVPSSQESDVTVDLSVASGFPQGADYVFECNAEGFEPTAYYWYFGDGQIQPNSLNANVWYTYTANGEYTVACTATNGTVWQTDTLIAVVNSIVDPSVTVTVDEAYPQGTDYVFECNAEGFTPLGYDWDFGDGDVLYDQLTSDVYHTYTANGEYTVTCTASDGETTEMGNTHVIVDACAQYELLVTQVTPNPAEPGAELLVSGTLTADGQPVETELVSLSLQGGQQQDASVLMGQWLGAFTAPEEVGEYTIEAAFDGACEGQITASTTLFVEVPVVEGPGDGEGEQTLIEIVDEPLLSGSDGGAKGGCSWGYHSSDGACVKNEVETTAFSSNGEANDGNGDSGILPEDAATLGDGETADEDGTDLLTGAVIGGGILSWSWLLVLLAILAALGGAYWWQSQQ